MHQLSYDVLTNCNVLLCLKIISSRNHQASTAPAAVSLAESILRQA